MTAADDALGTFHREELVNALTHGFGAVGSVRRRYAHAVRHLFVLGGGVCHILAVATLL